MNDWIVFAITPLTVALAIGLIPSLLLWRKEKREEAERKRAEERKSVIILP
jgi:hypothetical protein